MAVAEGFRPTTTVVEVLGHSYGRMQVKFELIVVFSKMEAELKALLHYTDYIILMWILDYDYTSRYTSLLNEVLE